MTIMAVSSLKSRAYAHARCESCGQPVSAEIKETDQRFAGDIWSLPKDDGLLRDLHWRVERIWPEEPKPRVPDHLPPQVIRAMMRAEENFGRSGMEVSAAADYGRALDVGTKIFAQGLSDSQAFSGQSLNNRINMLRKGNHITKALADWAHEIREIRNDALHEIDDITRPELTVLRGFTEMVLTYLFTLPAMLEERKTAAGEKRR